MATYRQIQLYIKQKYNVTIKTCWIADMKEKNGIKLRIAPNRISLEKKVYPCPNEFEPLIKDAFTYFNMVIR